IWRQTDLARVVQIVKTLRRFQGTVRFVEPECQKERLIAIFSQIFNGSRGSMVVATVLAFAVDYNPAIGVLVLFDSLLMRRCSGSRYNRRARPTKQIFITGEHSRFTADRPRVGVIETVVKYFATTYSRVAVRLEPLR